MLVGIVQVDDVQVLASSVVVKERHGSKHVEDAEPFCMEGGRDGAAIGGEMDSSGGGEGGEEEKSAVSRNKEEKHGRMERERESLSFLLSCVLITMSTNVAGETLGTP